MKIVLNLFSILLSVLSIVSAQASLAPPSFNVAGLGKGVFVDFKKADYSIQYDLNKKEALALSKIQFEILEEGAPVFDLVPEPISVSVDNQTVGSQLIQPAGFNGKIRVANKILKPGLYTLEVTHKLTPANFLEIDAQGVANRFDFDDYYKERGFLEQYLPANFEYDQVQMNLSVEIVGSATDHNLYTNGAVTQVSKTKWEITYPEFYNSSSIFFHIAPKTRVLQESKFDYTFLDGSKAPVTVYSVSTVHTEEDLANFVKETKRALELLEKRFVRFPHEQVIILMSNGGGGMEYAGATITDLDAVYHELAHSYFGRAVLSSSGRSAWIDEAMASFISGNPAPVGLPSGSVNLASMSPYARKMLNYYPYSYGQAVVKSIGNKFEQKTKRSFDNCIRDIFETRKYTPNTTEFFQSDLEGCVDEDLTALFDKFVYGKGVAIRTKALPQFFTPYPKKFTEF